MLGDLSLLVLVHLGAASIAIILVAMIFLLPKGTLRHRVMGSGYIAAMFVTVVSVVPVRATVMPFFGTRFGFFHVFVLFGFGALLFGVAKLWRWRKTRDVEALRAHQVHLAYSYAGLLMAGFSQLATNPRWQLVELTSAGQFWGIFTAVNAAIYGGAVWLIQSRLAKGDPRRWYPQPA